MASPLSGLARALAARPAAVPRAVGLARAALVAHMPAFVAGLRFYGKEELARRRRTLLMVNVPWEMSDSDVQDKVEGMGGFESIAADPEHRG